LRIYCQKNFEISEEYYKEAEKRYLRLRNIEPGRETSDIDSVEKIVTQALYDVHRRLAITYCRLGQYRESSRYVKPKKKEITITDKDENITYERELELKLERRKEQELMQKHLAKGVTAQDHPVVYLALAIIAYDQVFFIKKIIF
jgi:hypothetical protein